MNERKLYYLDNTVFKSFKLVPDFEQLEELKKSYVNNPANQPLFYTIISREYPTWESKEFVLPISVVNGVGGIFSKQKESILSPLNPVPKHKQHLLDVYCKHDLMTPKLKLISDDDKSKILYYFLFLSEQYKGKYKLNHFDNILSLSKDLFTYELLLNGQYENASLDIFDEVNLSSCFNLYQTAEFSTSDLQSFLSESAYNDILNEEQITHKLVRKISGN